MHDKDRFFFDNVDVYPDDDGQQRLGLSDNRWKELHAVSVSTTNLKLSDLEPAPAGVQTVELVIDPLTGKIYRKN